MPEIYGTAGDDILNGGNGNDKLYGLAGNDTLNGGAGSDLLDGGQGNDRLLYSADAVWGSGWAAFNAGSPGHPGTGALVSILGYNRSYDVFVGGTGADSLIGTGGNDALFLDDPFSPFPSGAGPRISGVEYVAMGNGADIVDLTSSTYGYGDVTIDGGSGNDILWSSSGNDVLIGGTGADAMVGGFGNDTYYLDHAGDTVTELANEGWDTMCSTVSMALPANVEEVCLSGPDATNVSGNSTNGLNVLFGNENTNTLTGGTNSNHLWANEGTDTLTGGSANAYNHLDGGEGADYMVGGGGDNTFIVDNAGDVVVAGGTYNRIMSSVSYALPSGVQEIMLTGSANLTATGNGLGNTLFGNAGNSTLNGGGGNDYLWAGTGGTTLNGGSGDDVLIGGAGHDTFQFGAGDQHDLLYKNAAGPDELQFTGALDPLDLIFSQSGNDLEISLHNTNDRFTIANWYGGAANQVETFRSNGMALLNTQVANLISDMASAYGAGSSAWAQAIADDPGGVQLVLASYWT